MHACGISEALVPVMFGAVLVICRIGSLKLVQSNLRISGGAPWNEELSRATIMMDHDNVI